MSDPVFDAYVMVDWSAESRPKTGPDSIWWVCLERSASGMVERTISNPPTRARAEAELADLLSDLAARGLTVLVGLDFALGYPAGFADAIGARDWKSVWRRLAAEIKDGDDNANNRFEVAAQLNRMVTGGPAPFWGCPDKSKSASLTTTRPARDTLPRLRATEARMSGTKSVWQLFGNGSVGGQTLLGIARLHRLRFHPWLAEQSQVWPFETGLQPLTKGKWRILFAEIYPSMLPVTVPNGGVKDCEQVRSLAQHFAAMDATGTLSAAFAGPADLSDDDRETVEREEGWILGAGLTAAAPVDIHDWIKDPAEIYRQSFATIRREVALDQYPTDVAEVLIRIIHSCGMTEIAPDMAWSPGAIAAGRDALAAGAPILVDAEMVSHGIIRRLLPAANQVVCTLNDPTVAPAAKAQGTTRSAMAVESWLPQLDGAIVAIGNAPTALFHLLELIKDGAPKPALILGFPVGFVGAQESKEALAQSGLPFLTLRGRKGGSAMAAAAVNALAGRLE
ncbi:MAG: precorrin-8X methylmutase [Rhodospirillaceae bacterium]|nr:precorrin-8X methylmutase [Rhodospirillales bacterium]